MEHPPQVMPPEGMAPPEVVPPPTPPDLSVAPPAPGFQAQKKVVSMPSDQIAKIRRQEREKGEKRAQDDLIKRVKAAGFESLEAMEEAAKRRTTQVRPAVKPSAAPAAAPTAQAKGNRDIQRLEAERQAARRQAAISDKKRRDAVRELDKHRAETSLREAAVQAGVSDAGYALHLLREHLASLSPQDMQSFDEHMYFAGLKVSKPHLFLLQQQPASTAPAARAVAPSTTVPVAAAPAGALDANKLSPEQYHEVLRKRGIRIPGLTP